MAHIERPLAFPGMRRLLAFRAETAVPITCVLGTGTEIHDTGLNAAPFCLPPRYVGGLATRTCEDPDVQRPGPAGRRAGSGQPVAPVLGGSTSPRL
jgi:hypothetical protein